ncbi:hypothetical protein H920_00435 [Fukomys damarensis]|uniref:Uncharacterized protein n=1 Tax=Fukomys damarensis TaxID=885580 RepID=A0A091E6E6_FUKDA|nr:hypothetical protein H920_00435 [Fukomys damarensis]
MSQARQGHRKEESDYSKDGQRSRQPECTLQRPGILALERQPAKRSSHGAGTLGAPALRAGDVSTECSMKRLCLACQPGVRTEAEDDAAVGFQLSD